MTPLRALLTGLLVALTAAVWAQSGPAGAEEASSAGPGLLLGTDERIVPAERELADVFEENGTRPVTDLTLDEIDRILDLRSVANQQHGFVDRAVARSFLVPGLGHYTSGERRDAVAFAATAAAIELSTLAATYWLLPPAVQYRNLNYLQNSLSAIEERWKSIAPIELVPATAAALTGGLLSLTVRVLAARGAEESAMEAIETGAVRFEALPLGGVAR